MSKPKLLVLGSTNLDTTMLLDRFVKEGETKICKTIYETCGGKGANQAVACAKLGAQVQFITSLGNDKAADEIINNFKNLKINTKLISKDSKYKTGKAFIMLDKTRSNCLIVYLGANQYLSIKNSNEFEKAIINHEGLITQLETNLEPVIKAINLAKKNKKIIFLNPAPANLDFDLKNISGVDFFIPNHIELDAFTKCGYETLKQLEYGANKILKYGVKKVIVTLGEKGVLLVDKSQTKVFKAKKVKAVDTVGAGDCFVSSFAFNYLLSKNVDKSIKFAILASAYSVTQKGAQASYGTLKQINNFIKIN